MERVIGYIRVSTDKQDLQRQKVEIEEYCVNKHLQLLYYVEEKKSGAKKDREGLQKLLQLTKKDADIVIISELSRLTREDDIMDVLSEINIIRKNGIDLLILDTDTRIKPSEILQPYDLMKLVFTAVGNAQERKRIVSRMSDGRYTKIVKNHYAYVGGPVPFGFKIIPNPQFDPNTKNDREPKTIFIEDKKEIKILESMYQRIVSGYTLHRLAKEMISEGNIISNGNYNNYQALITDILHNELYIGKRMYRGKTFDIKPVINRTLFNDAIAALKKNRWIVSYSSNYNPLKGILYCSCGRGMYYTNCKEYRYYKCYKKKDDAGNIICCNYGVKAETIFTAIWKSAITTMVDEEFQYQTTEEEKRLSEKLNRYQELRDNALLEKLRKQKELIDIEEKIYVLSNKELINRIEKKYEDTQKEIELLDDKENKYGLEIVKIIVRLEDLYKINKGIQLESLSLERKSDMLHQVVEKAVWCSDVLRKGLLQVFFKNGVKRTLLIQTDRTHSIILQFPSSMQLDLVERKVKHLEKLECYSVEDILNMDYKQWVINESIIDGFKHNQKVDDEQYSENEKPQVKRTWICLGHRKVSVVKDEDKP